METGVQCKGFKWAGPPTDDVYTIMDPLVNEVQRFFSKT